MHDSGNFKATYRGQFCPKTGHGKTSTKSNQKGGSKANMPVGFKWERPGPDYVLEDEKKVADDLVEAK